jgi:hypothetical protein
VETIPFIAELSSHIASSEIKVTLCDLPNSSPLYTDVIVYPDKIIYQVLPSAVADFAAFLCREKGAVGKFEGMRNSKDLSSVGINEDFPTLPLPWDKLVLVCVHAARDKRCGRAGPQVVDEMKKKIASREEGRGHSTVADGEKVAVLGSSHIGGHVFAGTLIVYPSADWYGQVTGKGESVEQVLDAVYSGHIYEKCYRGCGSLLSW